MMLPLVAANLPREFPRTRAVPHVSPVMVEARPGRLVCVVWAGTPAPQ